MHAHTKPVDATSRTTAVEAGPAKWIDVAALLYAAFLIYASLLPMASIRTAATGVPRTLFGLPITDAHLPDALSNLVVYLPLGLLLRCVLVNRRLGPWSALAITLLTAAFISYVVELTQTLLASRVASLADFVCNVSGAAIGCLVFAAVHPLVRRTSATLNLEIARDPTAVRTGMWALLVCLVALIPFDLVMDVSFLARSIRQAEWVPFARHADLIVHAQGAAGAGPADAAARADIDAALLELWQHRLDYLADVALFAILAVLAARMFRCARFRRSESVLGAAILSVAVAAVSTAASLFVMSVGLDATRLVTRGTGALIGAASYLAWSTRDRRAISDDSARGYTTCLTACAVVMVLYIAARQLAPFDFTTDPARVDPAEIELLPFHAYALAKFPQAAADLLHKSFRFAAVGVLLALRWLALDGRMTWKGRLAAAGGLAGITAALELAQCWLPARGPAVTDVLIAAATTTAGVLIAEFLWTYAGALIGRPELLAEPDFYLNVEIPPPDAHAPKEGVRRDPAPAEHAPSNTTP